MRNLLQTSLNWHLYSKNLLTADQYSFSPQTCSEDALFCLKNMVHRDNMKDLCTIFIFLHFEEALDNA